MRENAAFLPIFASKIGCGGENEELNVKRIGLGLIGTGKIAHQLVDAVRQVDGIEAVALYSRTQASGSAFAEAEGISRVYTSLADLLSDGEVDAVYIASPNALHFEQAVAALSAGKHVLCEKPMTASADESERLFAEARARSLVLLEAMRPLHDPMLALVREALPLLGKVRRVDLEYCQYSSRYDRFKAGELPNAFNPRLANAALMDIGVYPMACLVALFGMPRRVRAESLFLDGGFEGAGEVLCEYDGFLASVSYSKITDSVTPSTITGENGALLIEKLSACESVLLKPRGEAARPLSYTPASNNMIHELADFRDVIFGKLPVEDFEKHTLNTMRLMDEVRKQNGIFFA